MTRSLYCLTIKLAAMATVMMAFAFGCLPAAAQSAILVTAQSVKAGCFGTILPQENPPTAPVGSTPAGVNAYSWQDVPEGRHVPVQQAWLDQQGYRLQADNGETISIPFVNDDLNVMKFARSNTAQTYFVNQQNEYPVLYLAKDAYVASSAAENARWQPISQEFNYSSPPVYVDVAPDWDSFHAMGWYPNMTVNGGLYGANIGSPFFWMNGYYVLIGGAYYRSWGAYKSYYIHAPSYVQSRAVPIARIRPTVIPWPAVNQRANPNNISAGVVHPPSPAGASGNSTVRREPARSPVHDPSPPVYNSPPPPVHHQPLPPVHDPPRPPVHNPPPPHKRRPPKR